MGHVTQRCSVYQSYMSGGKLWGQMSDNHQWRVLVTYLPKSNFSGQVGNVAVRENIFLLISTLENTAVFEWDFWEELFNDWKHLLLNTKFQSLNNSNPIQICFPVCESLPHLSLIALYMYIAIIIFEDNFMISKVYRESWLIYHFCSLGLLNC